MQVTRVKAFQATNLDRLEESINDFLREKECEVADIKYQEYAKRTSTGGSGSTIVAHYTAMVIYRINLQ